MSLTRKLRAIVQALPPGSSVNLPRDRLQQELDREGEGPPELLSLEDVAEYAGRSVSTVRGWCNSGDLPGAFRLNGGAWRIPAEALRTWLEGQQRLEPKPEDLEDDDVGSWRRIRGLDKKAG